MSERPLATFLRLFMSGMLLIQGCALASRPAPYSPVVAIAEGKDDPVVLIGLQKEYTDVLSSCETIVSKFERRSEGVSWTLIGLGIFGAALGAGGSVLLTASAANATLASLFSGGAGVAAGVQSLFREQGVTQAELAEIRNLIAGHVRDDMVMWGNIELTGDKVEIRERTKVIETLKGHCKFFSLPAKHVEVGER